MNKSVFIEELEDKTNLSKDICEMISNILEDNFIIGRKNKEKTISNLMEKLNFDKEKANEIYNIASSIIATEIKEKLKHPFKSQN